MAQFALPVPIPYANGTHEPSFVSTTTDPAGSVLTAKFPHTRAQLAAIARQHKPVDSYDTDLEADDASKVPSALVARVVALLVDEKEDELKTALKDAFPGMTDETVSRVSGLLESRY